MMETESEFEGWAILELMGHRKLGGYVRAVAFAGAPMIRIDVPNENEGVVATQFYSPSALYCMTPVTEKMAGAIARSNQPAPVQRWELPAPEPVMAAPPPIEEKYDLDDEIEAGEHRASTGSDF
jgi:hypothetical protein